MSEIEENGSLSFLDITITCESNKFVRSIHCKPTFIGIFTNFESFKPDMHKRGLIENLLHRSFRLCSSQKNFHWEIETLRYYATFKVRKFKSLFYKINTCLQKTTTCIGLQAEQIFSVNIQHTFSVVGMAFMDPYLYYFQKLQLVVKKF